MVFILRTKMILKTEGYSGYQPQACQERETGLWGLGCSQRPRAVAGRWGREGPAQKIWTCLYHLAVTNLKVILYTHHLKPLLI